MDIAITVLSGSGVFCFLVITVLKIDLWWMARKAYKQEYRKRRKEIDYLTLEINYLKGKYKK